MRVKKNPVFGEIINCFAGVDAESVHSGGAGDDLPVMKKVYYVVGKVEDVSAKRLQQQVNIFLSKIEVFTRGLQLTQELLPYSHNLCKHYEEKISILREAVELCRGLFWSHVECTFDVCREEVFLTRTWEVVSMTGQHREGGRELRAMFPGVNHPARTFFSDVCAAFRDKKEYKTFKNLKLHPVCGNRGDVVTGVVLCAHLKSLLCLAIKFHRDIKMREKRRPNLLRLCGIEHLKKRETLIDQIFWFGVLERIGKPRRDQMLSIREDGVVVVTPRYVSVLHLIIVG